MTIKPPSKAKQLQMVKDHVKRFEAAVNQNVPLGEAQLQSLALTQVAAEYAAFVVALIRISNDSSYETAYEALQSDTKMFEEIAQKAFDHHFATMDIVDVHTISSPEDLIKILNNLLGDSTDD